MALARRAFIVGGAHTTYIGKGHPDFVWPKHPDFGKRENPNTEDHLNGAVKGVLDDTQVDPGSIQRLYLGNFAGELFVSQGHMGAMMAGAHPAFEGKPAFRLEAACASGGLAVLGALDAIAAGEDTVLVAGVEVQTSASARLGADYLARAAHYRRQREIDEFTFPALFARRSKHYQETFGVSEEDIGRAAVKAYGNANRNPYAHMRAREMPLEFARETSDRNPNFLSNEEFKPYLKVSDCSQVSDGATAVLVVSEEGLRKLGKTEAEAVEIVGRGHCVSSIYTDGDPVRLTTVQAAAEQAMGQASITPGDLDLAEVHDCFTVTELMMYEALHLAEPGKGAELLRAGATNIDGDIAVNSGGGLVGFGHPVGATGVKQVYELFRQMKGQCGDYQVPKQATWGVTANMGGDDKTAVSLVVRNLQ